MGSGKSNLDGYRRFSQMENKVMASCGQHCWHGQIGLLQVALYINVTEVHSVMHCVMGAHHTLS
jgi:hypothetical protein